MRSCFDCKNYNDSNSVCTKDYSELPIIDEDESGSNCMEFEKGVYRGGYREYGDESEDEFEDGEYKEDLDDENEDEEFDVY